MVQAADSGDELLERLRTLKRVRATVFGHVHQEYDDDYEGIRILATPSTCRQFKPGSERFTLDLGQWQSSAVGDALEGKGKHEELVLNVAAPGGVGEVGTIPTSSPSCSLVKPSVNCLFTVTRTRARSKRTPPPGLRRPSQPSRVSVSTSSP